MEPQKILIFGLGFIFLAGITLFVSFKLQTVIASKKNKNTSCIGYGKQENRRASMKKTKKPQI